MGEIGLAGFAKPGMQKSDFGGLAKQGHTRVCRSRGHTWYAVVGDTRGYAVVGDTQVMSTKFSNSMTSMT